MSNATHRRTDPSESWCPESNRTAFCQTPLRSLSGSIPAAALAGAVVLAAGTSLRPGEVAAQPVYEERTGSANPLDVSKFVDGSRPSLVDIDGDGDLDAVVTEVSDEQRVSRNAGSATSPAFQNDEIFRSTNYTYTHLAFGDLDGDGDFDEEIMIGDLYGVYGAGSFLAEYPNSSPIQPSFGALRNDFSVAEELDGIALGDFDADGDLDLVAGYTDGSEGALAYFENTGSATASNLTRRTGTDNPFDGISIGSTKPTPEAGDIDGDGDLDLVVGKEAGTFGYVENTGSATAPSFTLRADASENPFSGFDVGDESAPALGDVDGDGDLDLTSGNYGGTGTNEYGELFYFENTGDLTRTVEFARASQDPFSVVGLPGDAVPALGDLDGDGDDDAVFGQSDGTLAYFVNTGDAENPTFVEQTGTANPLDGIDAGFNSSPALGDLDRDGDLDLVVGEFGGRLRYVENTGDKTSPAFTQQTGSDNPLDGFDVDIASSPALVDIDGDGDLDVITGNGYGFLFTFENGGDAINPSFTQATGSDNPLNGFDVGSNAAPRFSDLDRDGDVDAVIGGLYGTLAYFENTGSAGSPSFTGRTGSDNPLAAVDVGDDSQLAFSDLDADGDPDLAIGAADGTVETYRFGTSDVLPVELTAFTGRPDGTGIVLSWSTAGETNNTGFEVQKMIGEEAGVYDAIGFVEGAGTTDQPQAYRFRTDDLSPGTHRFRLKQVDADGSAELSETIAVDLTIESAYRLQAPAPNPASGPARMGLTVERPQDVRVEVFDLLGRRVAVPHEGALPAQQETTIRLGGDLSAGTYLVRVTGDAFQTTEKLTIVP